MFQRLKSPSLLAKSIWILYSIFFLIFFYTIYFIYQPEILYYKLQPFFAFDSAFYQFHFDFRQGYLSLTSQFILQFLYYPFFGSLILSSLLLFLAFLLRKVFQKTTSKGFSGIEFVIPLLLLWPLKYYSTGIELIISISIAVIFYLVSELFNKSNILKLSYQAVSLLAIVWAFGTVPAIILGILYFPKAWDQLKQVKTILSYLFLLIFLGTSAYLLFGIKIVKVQLIQTSFFSPFSVYTGYWLICIVILLIIALGYFSNRNITNAKFSISSNWKLLSFPAIIISVSIISIFTLYRNPEKYRAKIDLHIINKEWDKALSYSNIIGFQDRVARFQLNRALFAKGKMSEDLFSISQVWGEYGLLLSKEFSMDAMPYLSDFFYDLGYIKASKYCMLEFQTASPYAPISLERLSTTSLILGEIPICKKYYTILSKSIIYKNTYTELLKKLDQQPFLLIRENSPRNCALLKGDKIINLKDPDLDLYNILEVSPQNKMAFEYLMSYYILRNDLETFYTLVPMAVNSGYYKKMPKTWEEALILYYSEKSIPINSGNFKINPVNIERYKEFRNIFNKNNSNVKELKEALTPRFKTSFWYYRYFDIPDLGKKIMKSK